MIPRTNVSANWAIHRCRTSFGPEGLWGQTIERESCDHSGEGIRNSRTIYSSFRSMFPHPIHCWGRGAVYIHLRLKRTSNYSSTLATSDDEAAGLIRAINPRGITRLSISSLQGDTTPICKEYTGAKICLLHLHLRVSKQFHSVPCRLLLTAGRPCAICTQVEPGPGSYRPAQSA